MLNCLSVTNSLVCLCRSHKGDGILMFISANLMLSVSPLCDGLELLSVVVSNEVCKSCIMHFYRPPSSSRLYQILFPYILNPCLVLNIQISSY